MAIIANPYRSRKGVFEISEAIPFPSQDASSPLKLLELCPAYRKTPLVSLPGLAEQAGVAQLHAKDETARMGLGSFKALGAAYVIAHEAEAARGRSGDWATALTGRSYVTASAGNHGLSVAAGARLFGARAVIYLAETVAETFADRLRDKGAEVRREGADYEASMAAASSAAAHEGMTLLSDSSWQGYTDLPWRLMEGYLAMGAEITDAMVAPPSHVLLQAGVGGLAGAMAAHIRAVWGEAPIITVVEPGAAPALKASIQAGHFVAASGPVSNMGRLDCKEASLIALKGLGRHADFFATVSDDAAAHATEVVAANGIISTPSGVAGIAALLDASIRAMTGITPDARVLVIVSETGEAG